MQIVYFAYGKGGFGANLAALRTHRKSKPHWLDNDSLRKDCAQAIIALDRVQILTQDLLEEMYPMQE